MTLRHLALLLASAAPLLGQSQLATSGINAGSVFLRSEPGQAATRVFSGNFHQPGGTGGQTVGNVNTFTGQPAYILPLLTLNARGEVAFPFSLAFSGPTFPTVENNNERAPAGWIGVGWSLRTPFVSVNHKGTRNPSDDVVFCDLGPYGGGQVMWQPETKRFHVVTAPGIIVTRDTVSNPASPLHGQVKAWSFTIPATGVRLVFGDAGADTIVNSHRYLQHAGGMIVASPYNTASAKPFIYRWDLRRLEDHTGQTGLDFEYDRHQEPLWGGKSYTRESYLKKAVWRDEFGNEVRRVELALDTLQAGEYSGYFPAEAKTSQKPFETRYLRSLTVFDEGRQTLRYLLRRKVMDLAYGKKGVLDSIIPLHGPEEAKAPGWSFAYRESDQLLAKITPPSGLKEEFEYQTLNLEGTSGGREGRYAFRDAAGNVVTATNNGDGWWPETACDDRFCHEIIRTTTTTPDRVHVRVAHNTGNYFDTEAVVFQKTLAAASTSASQWRIVPVGDYILIANTELATVELWEWDGKRFIHRNDSVGEPGDPIRNHFGYAEGEHPDIEVHPGGANYFLVYRRQERGSLKRRIWVYLRNPVSGKWTNLTTGTRGSAGCKFDNHPKPNGGGLYDPAAGDSCFAWRERLLISANDRMFAVREEGENLLYWYALNGNGTGFDSIGQLIPQFPEGIQETSGGASSPQNWNHHIVDLRFGTDHLLVKSATASANHADSRYDFLFYDGTHVKRIAALGWENDFLSRGNNTAIGINHDRYVLSAGNYFIHANTRADGPKRVEYWRKRQSPDSIYFEKTATIRTDIPIEGDADNRISLGSRHFSVENFPNGTFDDKSHPRKPPLTDDSGNIRSWLYRINDTAGVDSVPASAYTFQWDGCSRKAWNMSFSGLDNVLMGMTHRGTSGCGCTNNCRIRNLSAKLNSHSTALTLDTITDPVHSTPGEAFMRDRSWSFGARLAQAVYITHQSGPDTIWNRRYFFDGKTYSAPVTASVVRRFVRQVASDSAYPPEVIEFEFTPPHSSFITEFNHNSLTPQFEYAKITRRGVPGATIYTHHVDHVGYKLLLDSAGLSGRVRCITTLDGLGDTLSVLYTAYAPPYSRGWSAPGVRDATVADPWPQGVAMNRPSKTVARHWGPNRSHRTHRTHSRVWSDSLEAPLFAIAEQGGRRAVSQSILDGSGIRVERMVGYDYPDTANLTEAFLGGYRNSVLPLDSAQGKFAVSSSKVDYDPIDAYRVSRSHGWRDPGGYRGDEELNKGPVPSFDPDVGLFVASEVTMRDAFGQPLETRIEDGEAASYTSVFHEGRAALPVGVVSGARRENTAILTAENGSMPQLLASSGRLDREGRWEGPGVSHDSIHVRTGRYSLKVTDHYGPSTNIHLKDAREEGFGYIASAWIYGDMDAPPLFSVSWRRGSDNAIMRVRLAAPVDGAYARGKWQRWEIRIPHDSLVADGRFLEGSNDFLRVFIGPGDPSANPSRVIYVDDIVLRPDNSLFSLTAYDRRGLPVHLTDTHHRTLTREYGMAGQSTAIRDEHGRIFSQSGLNKPGEN